VAPPVAQVGFVPEWLIDNEKDGSLQVLVHVEIFSGRPGEG
jgi:hypothetical protein